MTGKEKVIQIPRKNIDLAYLCGVLAGDGSINIRKNKCDYEIKCVGNPKDEISFYEDIICHLIKKLFLIDIKSKYFDQNTTYGIRIWSKKLVMYLTKNIGLPDGKKYSKLKIPKVFFSDKKLTRSFIQGVFDTDFTISINRRGYPRIRGVSKSEMFITEIKEFLERDGFKVSKCKRECFDERVNKIVVTYEICLSGHKQFYRWVNKIGTRHPRHIKKMKVIAGGGFEPPTSTHNE